MSRNAPQSWAGALRDIPENSRKAQVPKETVVVGVGVGVGRGEMGIT